MSILKLNNLIKKYNEKAVVSDISLEIEKGEVFGLLGPNGAGKSTTISMICGLLKPTSGSIYLNDIDAIKNPSSAKKLLGLVPQEIALYPTLTAKENLEFWGKMYNIRVSELKKRVSEVLNIVGLEDRKNDKIESYSGGMKRRINIAAALLHRPELLIMDEPTVGIDPQSRNHILESVKNLNKEGMTIIYTSHYMEEVEYLCSRIGIIDHGKLLALGDKDSLKKSVIDMDNIQLELSSVMPALPENIKKIEKVKNVSVKENTVNIYSTESQAIITPVLSEIAKAGIKVLSMKIREPNLESVFLNLTGRELRD
ncbi:ABC transporter ATP-binding protein [Clostridium sp. 19966]|uniref:ABC transporter ATP-binding protein n=1 Tax=Clostridium sp. 19966 TaxID=2768166 RepID=UPI0028E6C87F|nr:ABC transporter ATP-binding protein [Clostridium sp. 19966]